MSYDRSPTLAQVIQRAIGAQLEDLRVSCPGEFLSFDSSTQLAKVKPKVRASKLGEDGEPVFIELPVISNVPVVFPGSGAFRITFPIAAGDPCLLVFSDRSLDEWLENGKDNQPGDPRLHHLSDAMAIPGLRSKATPITGLEEGVITIGLDSAAADFVALAAKVDAQLTALKAAFTAWVVVPNDGGAALKTLLTALITGPPAWPATVASAKVKVKG